MEGLGRAARIGPESQAKPGIKDARGKSLQVPTTATSLCSTTRSPHETVLPTRDADIRPAPDLRPASLTAAMAHSPKDQSRRGPELMPCLSTRAAAQLETIPRKIPSMPENPVESGLRR